MKENYTEDYDVELQKIYHYTAYPQMLPFIGKYYKNQKSKVLYIGESHYLQEDCTIHNDPHIWYSSTINNLDNEKEEIIWTDTRNIINSGKNQQYQSQAHSIYKNIELAILETGFNPKDTENMFSYSSFYNFFQRPAQTGDSIEYNLLDSYVAINVFQNVVKVIKPNIICFMSKKPWDLCWEFNLLDYNEKEKDFSLHNETNKISCNYFPHPGCAHWNTKSLSYDLHLDKKQRTGKEKLIDFLIGEKAYL